jgi:hypothetical protein
MSLHRVGQDCRSTKKSKGTDRLSIALSFAWLATSLAFTSGKAVAITRRSLHRLASERIPAIAMLDQRLLVGPAIPV